MSAVSDLRPLERVVVRLNEDGVPSAEIGRRIGKRPGTVERILQMVEFKKGQPARSTPHSKGLRPLERVIVRLRSQGESYGEIANRVGRSGAQVRRIEGYAQLKG